MKPYEHSLVSVKKWGGKTEDYQKIHDWFDQTKAHLADMRHRAVLHSSFGIFLCEQFFGINITNSDGKLVSVRDIGEQHMIDDLGFIPSVQDYLGNLPFLPWLGKKKAEKKTVKPATPDDKKEAIVPADLKPLIDPEVQKKIDEIIEGMKKTKQYPNPHGPMGPWTIID